MRTRPSSVLDQMRRDFVANGWDPEALRVFRMETDTGSGDGAGDGDSGGDDGGDAGLGDAGQRALAAEREKARNATRELKPWKTLATETSMTPEQIRAALAKVPKDDAPPPPDVDAIKREAEREASERANQRIVRAEVKALAADLFADPADAPMYLDLSKYDVDDSGDVNADEIKADLTKVLKSKPHLAKPTGRVPPGQGGARGSDTKPEPSPGLGRLRQAYESTSK